LNAWRRAVGGFTFEDAPNVVTSVAAIVRRINTRPNIAQPQVTRSSRVSNLENCGSTIIALESFLLDLSFPILSHIPQINPCPGQLVVYPQTGKRFFMSDRLAHVI
jgi:hypothetical protein